MKRLFGRNKKKNSSEGYYAYYEEVGVVPSTIEYYLEFGQEVEAEDIYWEEDHDDEVGPIVSYEQSKIPVLTIVEARTNTTITTTIHSKGEKLGGDTRALPLPQKIVTSTAQEQPQENDEDDFIEPGILETTLSEYEGQLVQLQAQPSMDEKTFCTISTVGFKSKEASQRAAEQFVCHHIRYKKSREEGSEEIKSEDEDDYDDDETLTTNMNSKCVITAPKRRRGPAGAATRIILHADAKGESTAAMTRDTTSISTSRVPRQPSCIGLPSTPTAAMAAMAASAALNDIAGHATACSTPANIMPSAGHATACSSPAKTKTGDDADGNYKPIIMSLLDEEEMSSLPIHPNPSGSRVGLLRKPSWFRFSKRSTTGSSRKMRFDDASTIATRSTHQLGTNKNATVVLENDDDDDATMRSLSLIAQESFPIAPVHVSAVNPTAPLAVLYDDKRNQVAWLRCAPRRRSFDFPIGSSQPHEESMTTRTEKEQFRVNLILPPTEPQREPHQDQHCHEETAVDDDVEKRDPPSAVEDKMEHRICTSFRKKSKTPTTSSSRYVGGDDKCTSVAGDAEERDPPPPAASEDQQVEKCVSATSCSSSKPELRFHSILSDSMMDDDDSDSTIETVGSTITDYKRKLGELQRRHKAIIKLIQDKM